MTGDLKLNDSVKAKFGTGNDLQIYHDSSNSYIDDNGTGDFDIRSNGTKISLKRIADGHEGLRYTLGGSLLIKHNNSTKLETTATGVDVTGNIAVSGTVDGRDVATDGSKLDGIEASADVTDATNVTAAGALMDSEVTNLSQVKSFDSSDYATAAQGTKADAALPKAGGTMTGNTLHGDNVKQRFGAANNLEIYADNINSYIAETGGSGNLVISGQTVRLSKSDGEIMLEATNDGKVDIRHDGSTKLETASGGIDVTGNIVVSGTVDGRDLATDGTKLDGVEASADVTDATNAVSYTHLTLPTILLV